jgi:hypothetical protein
MQARGCEGTVALHTVDLLDGFSITHGDERTGGKKSSIVNSNP